MSYGPSYVEAVKFPEARQDFLRKIDLGHVVRYVSRLVYIPHQTRNLFGNEFVMETCPSLRARLHTKGTKSKIKIYPLAFSSRWHENLDDFMATLQDHEGYHAKENYEIPEKIVYPLQKGNLIFYEASDVVVKEVRAKRMEQVECELRALSNEINNANLRKLSKRHMALVGKSYEYYLELHRKLAKTQS
jgi:hypothetical protein